MESPQIFGAAEECHSSESGWTMYIGSPVEDEEEEENDNVLNHHATDGEFDEDEGNYNDANHDDTSDDSMASDASSGPSYREQSWEVQKGGSGGGCAGGAAHYKSNEAKQNGISHCSNYKSKGPPMKKNRHVKGNEEKDKHEVHGKGAEIRVHGSKVRKSHWMGKRK